MRSAHATESDLCPRARVPLAWDTFAARWGRLVGMYAVVYGAMFAVVLPVWVAWFVTITGWARHDVDPRFGSPAPEVPPVWMFVTWGVMVVLIGVVSFLDTIWTTRLGLDATCGRELTLRRFFTLRGTGRTCGAAVLLTLCEGLGMLFCIVPGIVIAVLGMFVLPLVQERGMDFAAAWAESSRLVRANLGGCLLFALAVGGVLMVAGMVPFGVLAAAPVAAILRGCLYREVVARTPLT